VSAAGETLQAREPGARYLAAEQPALVREFELLATAPAGARRLRALIQTLAVQGKLLAQQPADEPAHALLARLRANKARMASAGEIRAAGPLPEVAAEDQPFNLPASWAWARFGDITINRDGERIPVSSSDRERRRKIYDYYGASGVIDKIDGYLFDKTLLLIGEDGANLLNRSTPIAFLAHGKYWVNNHAHVIDAIEPGLMRYLELFINAISLEPYVTGTAQPKMNQARLNNIVVALPPLDEQARIVARVDELMRLCDALETQGRLEAEQHARLLGTLLGTLTASSTPEELAANWQRVADHFDLLLDRPEAVDALEQTILQLAVRGLLVPQDPSEEPATVLIEQIRAARAGRLADASRRKASAELPEVEQDEWPFEPPPGWVWTRFGEVTQVSGGVTLGRKGAIALPVTRPYLRVANVQRWKLALDSMKDIVIDEAELPRYRLAEGDLLITEGGDWDKVGRTAVWRSELSECLHQNHVFKARGYTTTWNHGWAELYLNLDVARAYFAASAKQTTNLASINITELRHCVFPLPPLNEQSRIVTRVTELRRLCAALRQRLAASQATQSHLAEAWVESAAA
jgi:type I restriction enzyme S subunit